MTQSQRPSDPFRLEAGQLRWRCDVERFSFKSTDELNGEPIRIIGQPRAQQALQLGVAGRGRGYNIFVSGEVGCGRSTVVRRALEELPRDRPSPDDLVFVRNFADPDRPRRLGFAAGRGKLFRRAMCELVESMTRDLHVLFDSEEYRKRRAARIADVSGDQQNRLKAFEVKVKEQGFALAQQQMGSYIQSRLVPVFEDEAVDFDRLAALAEEGKLPAERVESMREQFADLQAELETLGKEVHRLQRHVRDALLELDLELAKPLVSEAVDDLCDAFSADQIGSYMEEVRDDILDNLDEFRQPDEADEQEGPFDSRVGALPFENRYAVNLVADHSRTVGPPIIWETNPSFRNLFGTIEKSRGMTGEWETDHMRIKAGSLLTASGGFLVIDAMDLLVEPTVWSSLKRTLRHRQVEIQSYDPSFMMAGVSLKPEPVPIDVKVILIGTPHIYRTLFALDEDFKKIFKIKAEFAAETALSGDEMLNYAGLIQKRVRLESLPPFSAEAVGGVIEYGVRLAGDRRKLTTRFTEIVDVVREAGYWAASAEAELVSAEHVETALEKRVFRVNLFEELMRDRIADGSVLIDIDGEKIGQVNGLALLDLGDHEFALPSRITATVAMGRAGIIDIDREAEMSGAIHTKGVLILTGFLRWRFAQDKPLTLTASICFEQNYGGIDGDSASSAELYALLSSVSGVPLRQGIAVTGSVNQRGEVQPIGGVNRKIEGFFDLCRLKGFDGRQGVLIPTRNLAQLQLRRDVVEAVSRGRFHVWAVSTIEEGLEVLTGRQVGKMHEGQYAEETIYGLADARLRQLAVELARYGPTIQ